MNKYLFIDAISCLDQKLIEEHIFMRRKFKTNKIIKKRVNILKRTLIASCATMFLISAILLPNLFIYKNADNYISASTTGYIALSLIISLVFVVIIGVAAWTIGKIIIKKRCNNYSML